MEQPHGQKDEKANDTVVSVSSPRKNGPGPQESENNLKMNNKKIGNSVPLSRSFRQSLEQETEKLEIKAPLQFRRKLEIK